MTRRHLVVTAVDGGKDYVLTGWKADEVIESSGRGAVWSRRHNGWLLYADDVPDIVAAAQHRNITLSGELPPVKKHAPVANARVDSQLALFGGGLQ